MLQKLDEFNAAQIAKYDQYGTAVPNGIACPQCGKELFDDNPHIVLTMNPPRTTISCYNCGYCGYRVA